MGKLSLKDTVDTSEITDLGEEINIPNIILEESAESGYGILGSSNDYSLVAKRIAYRSPKEEDNVDPKYKAIKYIKWEDYPYYSNTLLGCVNGWIEKRSLTKVKALKKAKFGEVEKIYNETRVMVRKAMKSLSINGNNTKEAMQMDNYNKLLEETNRIKSIIAEADSLHDLIKEKRKIVIKDTEPTKHRTKKENGDI